MDKVLLSILLILLHLILFIKSNALEDNNNLIQLRIYASYKELYSSIKIGFNDSLLQFHIDLDSQYTIMYPRSSSISKPLSNNLSRSDKKTQIEYDNNSIMANDERDIFIIPDTVAAVDLSFFIVDRFPKDKRTYKHGAIGLGSLFQNDNYSLLHQLKKNNLISRLEFSLSGAYNYRPYLSFGGIPQSLIKNKSHQHCNIKGKGNKWSCPFKELLIRFNDGNSVDYFRFVNTVNAPARFSLKDWNILVPLNVYDELIKYVQSKATKGDQCAIQYNFDLDANELKCLCSFQNKFLETFFVFEDMEYTLKENDLFWYSDFFVSKCIFNVGVNQNGDGWIFGYAFLKQFNTLFDYDNKKIHFYNNNNDQTIQEQSNRNNATPNDPHSPKESNVSTKAILLSICLFILIISIVILYYAKYALSNSIQPKQTIAK